MYEQYDAKIREELLPRIEQLGLWLLSADYNIHNSFGYGLEHGVYIQGSNYWKIYKDLRSFGG